MGVPVGVESVPMTLCGYEAASWEESTDQSLSHGLTWLGKETEKYGKHRVNFGEQSVPIVGMRNFTTYLRKGWVIWLKWNTLFSLIWS